MAYFVYRITPPKKLDYIDEHDQYRAARMHARTLRAKLDANDTTVIKVIFAPNREHAEGLLLTEREPRPLGEDA